MIQHQLTPSEAVLHEMCISLLIHSVEVNQFFELLDVLFNGNWSILPNENHQLVDIVLDAMGVPQDEDCEDGFSRDWLHVRVLSCSPTKESAEDFLGWVYAELNELTKERNEECE